MPAAELTQAHAPADVLALHDALVTFPDIVLKTAANPAQEEIVRYFCGRYMLRNHAIEVGPNKYEYLSVLPAPTPEECEDGSLYSHDGGTHITRSGTLIHIRATENPESWPLRHPRYFVVTMNMLAPQPIPTNWQAIATEKPDSHEIDLTNHALDIYPQLASFTGDTVLQRLLGRREFAASSPVARRARLHLSYQGSTFTPEYGQPQRLSPVNLFLQKVQEVRKIAAKFEAVHGSQLEQEMAEAS